MEEIDEFKANMIEPGVILLPSCDLLQYWITKEKKRPFNTVMRFGSPYVPLSVDQVDDLLDWVTEARKRLRRTGLHIGCLCIPSYNRLLLTTSVLTPAMLLCYPLYHTRSIHFLDQ